MQYNSIKQTDSDTVEIIEQNQRKMSLETKELKLKIPYKVLYLKVAFVYR